MGGGLAKSSRLWYETEIMRILKIHGKVSVAFILQEMKKINQHRYPIQEERVVAFLKYLRACGRVRYLKSDTRRISSKWDVEQ